MRRPPCSSWTDSGWPAFRDGRSGYVFAVNPYGARYDALVSGNGESEFATFIQFDDGAHAFGTNTRLRWTFDPVGDLFVVYNHNLRTRDPVTLQPTVTFDSNVLLVKVQYALRY